MEGHTANDSNMTPHVRRRRNMRTTIVAIILAIIAIVIIIVIVYLILRKANIIKDPIDLSNVTTSSLDQEISNFEDLTYTEQAEDSAELGDKVIAYAKQTESEKGQYNIDTIRANLSVADYYFASTTFSDGVKYLQDQLDSINKIENPSDDILEAKILYGVRLFTKYLDTGQTDDAAWVYTNVLEPIPEGTIMHENNWPVIRETMLDRLNQKLEESE